MKSKFPFFFVLLGGLLTATAWNGEWRIGYVGVFFLMSGMVVYCASVRDEAISFKLLVGVAILLRLFAFVLPPSLTDDYYRYVWDGVVQEQGVNPYLYLPSEKIFEDLQEKEIYTRSNSPDYYSVYPPVSQGIFRLGGMVYPLGFSVSYYVVKGVFALFELGALFLVFRMVSSRWVLLYAWNPLVIMETWGAGHSESAALFFITLSLYAVRNKQGWLAYGGLTLAGWVKMTPFFFMPLLVRRFGLRSVWIVLLLSLLVWIPYYAPGVLKNINQSVDLYIRSFEFNAGPYYVMKELGNVVLGNLGYLREGEESSKFVGPGLRALFFLLLPWVYFLDWRRRWSFAEGCFAVFCLFLLTTTTIHPWYFTFLLLFLPFLKRVPWNWLWLMVISVGTYLRYTHGIYWPFVFLGWGGWFMIALFMRYREKTVAYSGKRVEQ